MTILQLDPPLPLLTPKGPGFAHLVIERGIEAHLEWVVFLDESGECWTFENPDVRMQSNLTLGRPTTAPAWGRQWDQGTNK